MVRASALESKDCEFDSHWASILVTLGELLTLSGPRFSHKMSTWLRTVSTLCAPGKIVW